MLKISKPRASLYVRRGLLFTLSILTLMSSVYSLIRFNSHQTAIANSCSHIFNPLPKWVTDRVRQNRPVYEQVARETGVPWQVMAAIHYREFNLRRDINPYNGQGIYQMYSIYNTDAEYRKLATTSTVSDSNFLRQTRYAANFVQAKARETTRTPIVSPRNLTANETDLNLIKSTLFSYNGRASAYAAQAQHLGFNRTNQPFEGSPYVMNQFDCKRAAMGLITYDGGSQLNGTDTRLGAFTLYARLKGDAYWNSLQVSNIPGCKEATNTSISCVWRLYNSGTKKYTFTTSYDERNNLIAQGYLYQNVGFFGNNRVAPKPGNIPIYEIRNSQGGSLLTASKAEYDVLKSVGWTDKGVAFYANPYYSNAGKKVHRLYDSKSGAHVFTSNSDEVKKLRSHGYTYENVAFTEISTVKQEKPAPNGQYLVYRFGSMPGNTHFWTTDINERDSMIRSGYRYEGAFWRVYSGNKPGRIPVYRLYSEPMKKHLFTKDLNEKNTLNRTSSWRYEGIAFYASKDSSNQSIHRVYLRNNHSHFLTHSSYERDQLTKTGVGKYEGSAWYQP